MTNPQEEKLIARLRTGDTVAFNQLIAMYRPMLVEYAQQALGDRDDAEDAVQNATIYAWTHLSKFGKGKFKSWLLACVKNRNLRLRDSRPAPEDSWEREIPEPEIDPVEVIATKEEVYNVISGIDELPPTQREVMRLCADGCSQRQIAEIMGISDSAVRKNLSRARATLLECHKVVTFVAS